ncbi:3-hydroxyacyl-CoA dehydrogenase/enoyl-CoA hydratase family protein [Hyphomicrobium sp.]|uniref:3-hydroxyacyl-CoA dehydrogenase/enoyl-CoA hydratase family protein n=1 Tax=Hyphomicrobium sp. TaxID=82 RepID=UPI0025C09BCD|nr:3-hydroxyacyl-CoA dehydrogenase/enoyl-CoA hydratase family protein [Hyphomicrobium sp.]MCC7253979.1 enoyl-CoA hydratase/isomerase family protein [Hyphomicrobium sp.]
MTDIRSAAVIGAGIMGSGIAAHLANAGLDVVLLDLDPTVAANGVARQVKSGGFMDPRFAGRVRTGSSETDIRLISDADWIVEAVAERLDVKHSVYSAIASERKPGSIVSSNTSTIPLGALLQQRSPSFSADFLITHFFNPPRWMRLLEIVDGPLTNPDVTRRIAEFAHTRLGKGIVSCKDTPGFIANRIGTYWMGVALNEAIKLGIDIEEADAFLGKPFGIPETGLFGLLDLIGIDLMPSVLRSLQQALPATDPFQDFDAEPPLVARMIGQRRTGRKAGAGFFRLTPDRKGREALDLISETYRPLRSVSVTVGTPRAAMQHAAKGGQLADAVMRRTLSYAATLVPEISDSIADIDEAMRLGYGWKEGPFELIDRLDAAWFAKALTARGMTPPALVEEAAREGGFYTSASGRRSYLVPGKSYQSIPRPDGSISLSDLSLSAQPVAGSESASLWDLGDGVACLELRSKMNTFNFDVLRSIEELTERVSRDFRALVIGTELPVFSAGADLRLFLNAIERNNRDSLRSFIVAGQRAFRALKFAPFPVVAAAAGRAVGGGLEFALHCDAIQAHAELQAGLVETSIGVIPAWGGCTELLLRVVANPELPHGPVAPALHAFNVIGSARISSSAFDALRLGYLRPTDRITMNRERLLSDAKATAIRLSEGYAPPEPQLLTLSGRSGASALVNVLDTTELAGRLSPHDRLIGEKLAWVLSGGSADPTKPLPEEHVLGLECEAFLELATTPATRERITHMLERGKPLRN